MRKKIVFWKDIEMDTIKELTAELEASAGFDIDLYWSSVGGDVFAINYLLDYIDGMEEDLRVIVNGGCYSAGFTFLYKIKREVLVPAPCMGLIHLVNCSLSLRGLNNVRGFSTIQQNLGKELDEIELENITKLGLAEEDLERIKNGEDYVFGSEKFREIIERAQDLHRVEGIKEDLNYNRQEYEELKRAKKKLKDRLKGKKA